MRVPPVVGSWPFRGSVAVGAGVLTWARLRGGGWRRLFPDVYVDAAVPLDHRMWCEAAVVYAGRRSGVAVSGMSAALLLGVALAPPGDSVELTVPRTTRPGVRSPAPSVHDGIRVPGAQVPSGSAHSRGAPTSQLTVVRSALAATDVTAVGRLPVTTPDRTAFDIARRLPLDESVVAVDAMLNRGLVTRDSIRRYALDSAMRRGCARVMEVVALAEPGAESPMETRLRLELVGGGLPRPEAQVAVYSRTGEFLGRVDLAYREHRVGIEYEGDYHRDRNVFRRDLARVNAMQEAGWVIVRVTVDDIRDPRALLRQLRALLSRPAE